MIGVEPKPMTLDAWLMQLTDVQRHGGDGVMHHHDHWEFYAE